MGCGESKHSVATENTITRKKSSKKMKTINETIEKESLKQEEERDNNDNGGGVAEVKDITEDNKELKEEEEEKEMTKKEDQDQETGRLISKESPNHFFSSRKDDQDINGGGSFASEAERSDEKSEFFSPRLESVGKEALFNECVKLEDAVEEKLVQETEQGETSIVKEEDMTKAKKASTSPPEEKKNEEETSTVSPSKDLKEIDIRILWSLIIYLYLSSLFLA